MKLNQLIPFALLASTPLAFAVPYWNSNGTGGGAWSASTSWTPSGVPDTYAVPANPEDQDVTILLGDTITADASTSSIPGGAVSAGGFAIANGNIVTIDGGILNSSVTNEMRVGEGSGALSGDGTLTVKGSGSLDTGSSIALIVGTTISGVPGNGFLDIQDGSVILGLGAVAGGLGVGVDGSTGALNISAGGSMDLATNNIQGGVGVKVPGSPLPAGTGSLEVINGLMTFGTSSLYVGQAGGNGTFTVDAGGVVNGGTGNIIVGIDATSLGAFISSGAVTATGDLYAGRDSGQGNVTISGGATSVNHVELARGGASTNTTDISGGSLTSTNFFNVGQDGGIATINQTGGTVGFGQWMAIGLGGGPAGSTYNISNGFLTSTAGVEIGSDRRGEMYVSGNANVNVGGAAVGVRNNSDGYLKITGGQFKTTGNFSVGGAQSAGVGVVDYNGGVLETGEFRLGITGGTGTININNGTWVQHGWGEIGSGGGATGTMNVTGVGSVYSHTEGGSDLQVGYNGGTGNVNVLSGGTFTTNWWLNIARGATSTGHVTIDGAGSSIILDPTSTIANGGPRVNVGEDGTGTMILSNNALIQVGSDAYAGGAGGREFYVGRNSGSHGLLEVHSGSEVHANGDWGFIDGQSGTGVVNVDTGGKILANNWTIIGNEAGSNGTLSITDPDSVLRSGTPTDPSRHEGRLIVGRLGVANLNQSDGIVSADNWIAIGIDGGGNGTYNFSGGQMQSLEPDPGARNVVVGNHGTGTLNISHGDPDLNPVAIGNGGRDATWAPTGGRGTINYFNVAGDSGGIGIVNIDLEDPSHFIQTRELYAGWSGDGNLLTAQTSGTININTGTLVTNEWVEIGRGGANSGGTGIVNVNGSGAKWERGTVGIGVVKDINMPTGDGANRGSGNLNVYDGGTVNQNWWINLARQPNNEGHILITGAGSTINMVDAHLVGRGGDGNSQLNVGESGTGTLDILAGGVFNHNMDHGGGEVWIARNDNSKGTMTIDGIDSAFHSKGREVRIGENNNRGAVLNITNGGVFDFNCHNEAGDVANGNFLLAEQNSATATVNMEGGSLNVEAWGFDAAWGDNAYTSVATVNMTDSTLNITNASGDHGRLLWGRRGSATINQSGGSAHVANWAVLGVENGGKGYWNLSNGATAQLDNELNLGHGGPDAYGKVSLDNAIMTVNGWTTFGRDGAGLGELEVTNGGQFRHLIPNSGDMLCGWNNGRGNININNGTVYQSWWARFGLDAGSVGTMTIDNAGQFITGLRPSDGFSAVDKGAGHFRIGENGTGTVTVSNGSQIWHQGTEFRIATDNGTGTLNINDSAVEFRSMNDDGTQAGGNFGIAENNGVGTLNMTNGLLNVSGWSLFGGWNQPTSKATINMTDSVINLGATNVPGGWGEGHLFFGDIGTFASGGGSTINQEGGAIHASGWSAIGRERGGDSVYNLGVNGGGGLMTVGGAGGNELYVGRQSHGQINMGPGSSITVANVLNLAQENSVTTPSKGTVINNGGAITVGGEFNVGRNGGPGNVGFYSQTAGLLTVNGEVFVGRDSTTGTLSMDGGAIAQLNNNIGIGMGGGSSVGTVNLDGVGTTMTTNGWLTLGRDTGGAPTLSTLNISNGAHYKHNTGIGGDSLLGWQAGSKAYINITDGGVMDNGWWTRIGVDPGSEGHVLIDGAGSKFNVNDGRLYIGEKALGTVTISNGGQLAHHSGYEFGIGEQDGGNAGGPGVVNIDADPASSIINDNFIRIGHGNTGATAGEGTINMDGGSISAGNWMGFGHEGGHGVLNMTGGAITYANEFYIGIDDNGHTLTTTGQAHISGGSITQTGGGAGLFVGRNGGNGLLEITGVDPVAITIINETHIGQGGVGAGGSAAVGTVNIDNAATVFTVTNGLYVGQDGGTGTVNQNTGTVSETNQWLTLGAGGGSTGTYNLTGGALNANVLEVGADGVGTLNVSGGTAIANAITVGTRATGVGVMNISGGLLQSNDHISLGGDQGPPSGQGTLNLTGGVVQTHYIDADGDGVPFANLDGGTLRAGANEGNFLRNFTPANSEINGGGVTIDSNGFSITAQNVFDGPGALTKVGAGVLKLTADNQYAGGTSVTGGKLYVSNTVGSGTGPADVTVSGATSVLGGYGTISGSVTASGGGSIAPGESTGVLTVGTNTTFTAASNLVIEINDAATPKNDTLVVTGALDITGATLVLNVTGTPAEPVYVIATYGSLVGASFVSATPPTGYTINYSYLGNSIALVATPSDPYAAWIAGFSTGGLSGKLDDADGDGVVNLIEFALGGNDPTNASDIPALVPGTEVVGPDSYFTVSSLVRIGGAAGIVGAGQPTNATAIDNLKYTVEGSASLDFSTPLSMQPTTLNPDLPAAPADYEWVTFRTTLPVSQIPGADLAQGRIRVKCPF